MVLWRLLSCDIMRQKAREGNPVSRFKELFEADMHRYGQKGAKGYCRWFSYFLRKASTSRSSFMRRWYSFWYKVLCSGHGMEIPPSTVIGKGFYVGHPYNITISPAAVLGENVNVHKGATIGWENRGKRYGAPTIHNNVWIGINATVVGNITIGEDVLIAPNAFVNCDVPAHSVVVGNPCKITPKEHATERYVRYQV